VVVEVAGIKQEPLVQLEVQLQEDTQFLQIKVLLATLVVVVPVVLNT
jgi:hypothetical protein